MMICVAGPRNDNNVLEAIEVAKERANGGSILLLDFADCHSTVGNNDEMRVLKYNVDYSEDFVDALHPEFQKTDVLIVDGLLEVTKKSSDQKRILGEYLEQLKSLGITVIVTYPIDGEKITEDIRTFFRDIIYLRSMIPKKASRFFDMIVSAVHNETLRIMNGLFNGEKSTFISIEMEDKDTNFVKYFPKRIDFIKSIILRKANYIS